MANFFISYSRKDAAKIANTLRDHIARLDSGHDIFLDVQSIRTGTNWKAELKRKIQSCDYFVYVHSPKSLESPYIKDELNWVKDLELKSGMRKLFVYRLGYAELTGDIADYQVLDATDNFTIDFHRLMTGIFSEHSFYSIEYDLRVVDEWWYKGTMWVEAPEIFLSKIQMVEYRFDYGWDDDSLITVKANARTKAAKFKISFDTKYHFTIFVMLYLWNTKEVYFVKKRHLSH